MQIKKLKIIFFLLVGVSFLSACHLPARNVEKPLSLDQIYDQMRATLAFSNSDENITQNVENPTQAAEINEFTNTPTTIFLHPGLPASFKRFIEEYNFMKSEDENDANIRVLMGPSVNGEENIIQSEWVYVTAAPFYTVPDNISLEAISELWLGERSTIGNFSRIYVTETTKAAVSTIFGAADTTTVNVRTEEALENIPLEESQSLIILPFESLHKGLKVIRIDGQSPIDTDFDPQKYPLSVSIWIESTLKDLGFNIPHSNFDPNLRTVLVMTGVTALTRATAHRMEIMGNQYPGQAVYDWLTSADLTHISNEVPFAANCPPPDPVQEDLIFCSSPERIELLEFVEADIIELTGNHLLDYGLDAVNLTLNMYEEKDWVTYAGGWDLDDAQTPALVNHNGNQIAFIGCNSVGPPNAWASSSKPGAAPCGDFSWMTEEIQKLREEGYLPIVTLQYAEDYTSYPSAQMVLDFKKLADAGAVVVNGSQAHTPKMMSFEGDSFLHYGLGNLFFDQMEVYYNDTYLPGTRNEFIDRLIFYDGELVSIELLSALLEDYARPRPMTDLERDAFLFRIFSTALEFNQ